MRLSLINLSKTKGQISLFQIFTIVLASIAFSYLVGMTNVSADDQVSTECSNYLYMRGSNIDPRASDSTKPEYNAGLIEHCRNDPSVLKNLKDDDFFYGLNRQDKLVDLLKDSKIQDEITNRLTSVDDPDSQKNL